MDNQQKLIQFAEHLKQVDGLLITAGAGMGVDSGLPDFRGDQGFWKAYPPLKHLGKSFVDMATPQLFHTDPKLAWGFYGLRLNTYRAVEPHQGFYLLEEWSETLPNLTHGAFVFTSNVDGEFQKVGFKDEKVYECHGSIHWLQCVDNCKQDIWSVDGYTPVVDEEYCQLTNDFPTCPHCGGLARPNILMFSDWEWQDQLQAVKEHKLMQWLEQVNKLAIIELGAGKAVPSVRNFGEQLVRYLDDDNVSLMRINMRESQVPNKPNCYGVDMGALDALVELNKQLKLIDS
ncbi:Sir2 family NAD-dependent protein deacetylase [Moraxella sp. CTOTU49803]|uniref:SIR2 family NAD-dependent protein deacylase n=1 Tax=Moraxella sp. CTOTU49803 TaxID=2953840 RepID=UPI0028B09C77|nr:Sir2 family NAD-dependent protein deacetylase [Moraxella sp. CTOTU49803]